MKRPPIEVLSVAEAPTYLVRRRLLAEGERAEVWELSGGISNVVVAVRTEKGGFVIKQALSRLRVSDEWVAKQQRIISEGEALRLLRGLTPEVVPEVLDIDQETCAIVMALAPPSWENWKQLLLRGSVSRSVAQRVGGILGTWHHFTWRRPEIEHVFSDSEAFDQLRVDPYHRTVMKRRPELAQVIGTYVDRMLATRVCLVHGDCSPKNVLVGPDQLWIIDFEVVHFGDPAFDVAFMLNHLMLKAIHVPRNRTDYLSCAEAFWNAYLAQVSQSNVPSLRYVLGHLGCLMLARVDGKSPAEYLTGRGRDVAHKLGARLVMDPPDSLPVAWQYLTDTNERKT